MAAGDATTHSAPPGVDRRRDRHRGHVHASHLADLLVEVSRTQPNRGVRYCSAEEVADSRLQTYPALLDEARQILAGLREHGAESGRAVAVLLDRPNEFLPVLWACLLGGMIACPLVAIRNDPQRWAAQLLHIGSLLDHPLLVTTERMRSALPDVAELEAVNLEDLYDVAAGIDPADVEIHQACSTDVALLVLTSGSTGDCKAVMLTHANLLASMKAKVEVQGLTEEDITLNWISYDHVAALLETHLLPLAVGAMQLHVTPEAIVADPLRLLQLIDVHRVTMTFTPNFLLGLINRALSNAPADPSLDLSSLRRIISGGEANPVSTGVAFLDNLAPYGLRRSVLWPAFGMTETCAGSIYNSSFPDADIGNDFAAVGHPVTGLRIRVAEGGGTLAMPEGCVGEVQLSGPMITSGYFNNARADEVAFTPDGWLRTGDLGRLVGGRLYLVGRSKDSIIVNGVNYFSHELETVLEELDGIEKSYVAVFPIRMKGSDTEQVIVAFATTVPDTDEAGLHRLLTGISNSAVSHWGFRPFRMLPLPREAFPKTSLGKLQRSLIRERLEAGRYDQEIEGVDRLLIRQLGGYVPPGDEVESELTRIYAELFEADPQTISTTASFFDLGGTSLDILRLKRLIAVRLGAGEVSVQALLAAPTVRDLARRLQLGAGGDPTPYDPIVPLQASGEKTPLFCVHPGVGEVLVFVNLAKYFLHERPFYALRARGFNPGEKPFHSFAEMARTYTEAIRTTQPHGPYAVAGYSFGAAVAFEIAKLLEAQGEQVDFIGSFNLPPHIRYRMEELDYIETAVNLAMFLELISKQQARELPTELRVLDRAEQLAYLLRIAPPERLTELDLDLPRFVAWADLADALTDLGRTYQPSGTVRAMSIFYATPLRGTKQEWLEKELRRWDDFTREANRFLDVPGEHYTLMGPKHVQTFQGVLRAELDRALRGR